MLRAEEALETLTDKQRFVIERREGYPDGRCYTQAEIAKAMGITQPGVWKIEHEARKKLAALAGVIKTGL